MKDKQGTEQAVGYWQLIQTNRNFRFLWFGQIVSFLGDWFNLIASASLIGELTESGLAIGGLFVVRMLAPFLVSPLAGVAADRYNRKWILFTADIIRAFVVLAFLLVHEPQHVWLLYALTAVQLGISGFFQPARNAILPDIVSPEELGAANALSSATWSVMLAFGAALGGFVAGLWGNRPAFIIDSGTFFLSSFFISRIQYEIPEALQKAEKTLRAGLVQYIDGLRYLWNHADILFIAMHKSANALFISAGFQVVQVKIAEDIFVYGTGGNWGLGMLYAFTGVGTGLGPIVLRWFTGDDETLLRRGILLGYLMGGIGLFVAAPLLSFGMVLLGGVMRGIGGGITWVFSTQLLLKLLPNEMRGRVFSSEFAIFTLLSATGAGLAGRGIDTGLGISGVLFTMGSLAVTPLLLWAVWIFIARPRIQAASAAD
ncbi:MAG: MFS transporter [Chloroflexota bacterium]